MLKHDFTRVGIDKAGFITDCGHLRYGLRIQEDLN